VTNTPVPPEMLFAVTPTFIYLGRVVYGRSVGRRMVVGGRFAVEWESNGGRFEV